MDNNAKSNPEWTPELEQRYQYVQKKYDDARFIGLDVLKILLGTAITLAAVPIAFYEKVSLLFAGKSICWIYCSWIFILLSVFFGFLAYLFVFEGYFHQAHLEGERWLSGKPEEIKKLNVESDKMFDCAHWFAPGAVFAFSFAMLSVIVSIGSKILLMFNG